MTYEICSVNPVYSAMFYDYNEQKHEEMIIIQLNDYSVALHDAGMKLWDLIFIFVASKIFFLLYFKAAHWIADRCCGAIRIQLLVLVDASLRTRKERRRSTAFGEEVSNSTIPNASLPHGVEFDGEGSIELVMAEDTGLKETKL